MIQGNSETVIKKIHGKNYILNYKQVEDMNLYKCMAKLEDYILNDANKFIFAIIITSLIFLALIIVISQFVSKSITAPISNIIVEIKKLSDGDMNINVNEKFIKRKDELGDITRDLIIMADKIKSTILKINTHSNKTFETSQKLSQAINTTTISTNEVSEAVGNIAEGATSQAQDTTEAASNIESINKLLKETLAYFNKLEKSVNSIKTKKDDGQESLFQLLKAINKTNKLTDEIAEVIISANNSADKISEASEMIESISDQTNLLALNVAIDIAIVM